MPHVDETLTRKVATLARLELTDEETRLFTQQIGSILEYVDQLQKIDVTGVEPLTHPLEKASRLRVDEVREFPADERGQPKVLRSAPEVEDGGFKVPPIL